PGGDLGERRRDEPGVLAPGAGRGEHGLEPEPFGRLGDLAEVVDGGRPVRHVVRPAVPPLEAAPAADDRPAVARGGQEPMESHCCPFPRMSLNRSSTNSAKSMARGIRPSAANASAISCSEETTEPSMGMGRMT